MHESLNRRSENTQVISF